MLGILLGPIFIELRHDLAHHHMLGCSSISYVMETSLTPFPTIHTTRRKSG